MPLAAMGGVFVGGSRFHRPGFRLPKVILNQRIIFNKKYRSYALRPACTGIERCKRHYGPWDWAGITGECLPLSYIASRIPQLAGDR